MTAKRQDQELVRMAEEAGFKRGHILANEIHADGVEITGALNKFASLIRAKTARDILHMIETTGSTQAGCYAEIRHHYFGEAK